MREPAVFLFDEPLSNLDAKLRVQMRLEIKELQSKLGITALYVTHDQVEAMTMADRMSVMNGGVAEQIGTPLEVAVQMTEPLGANTLFHGRLAGQTPNFTISLAGVHPMQQGQTMRFAIQDGQAHVFDAATGLRRTG